MATRARFRVFIVCLLLVLIVHLVSRGVAAASDEMSGGDWVTCGSLVKLLNTEHRVRLHSHDVKYGSGSGQQSVTGVEDADDGNSYWRVRAAPGAAGGQTCPRGMPVRCGQEVRLTHVNTGRNLHSHHFSSPLSGNQEVSAFGEAGEGDPLDVWQVVCGGGERWHRDAAVRLRHSATQALLSVTGEQYGRPISGQREVHAMTAVGAHNLWRAVEGVFIKPGGDVLKVGGEGGGTGGHTEL